MTKKILVVEDNSDIRRLIRITLEFEDVQILEAPDGSTGLQLAARERPDVAVLDVMMPGGTDGLEVCRRIKADPDLAATKVIMLSACGAPRDIAAATEAGACAYLVKPFSPIELTMVVAKHAFGTA